MNLIKDIDTILEATRFKKEMGYDAPGGISKMMKWIDEPWMGLHLSTLVGDDSQNGFTINGMLDTSSLEAAWEALGMAAA